MNLKSSPSLALESFLPVSDSTDLELLGPSFLTVFGKGVKFFYRATKIKNNVIVKYEVGLGYLEDNLLKRFQPLYHGLSGEPVPSSNGPQAFVANEGESLFVSSHIPASTNELLVDPHSVITSIASHVPHPVMLSSHSLLGRLDENVTSIPLSDIFNHPELLKSILEAVTTYSKQLSLRTSKLDAKKISTDCLVLNVNPNPPEVKGTLAFDGTNLKYYDGEKWRGLSTE